MKDKIMISGHFNVLHPGHQRLFKYAKTLAKSLIVAVESDHIAKDAAYFPEQERLQGVKNNSLVDIAVLLDEPIAQFINTYKPDIVLKGKEHDGKFNIEKETIEAIGGSLLFSAGETYHFQNYNLRYLSQMRINHKFLAVDDYKERHKLNNENISKILKNFQSKNLLVVGDIIIDEYINCEILGVSQEDANAIFRPLDSDIFLGGAAIVARHAAAMGAKVHFVSVSGADDKHEYVLNELERSGVSNFVLPDNTRTTILKKRYRVDGISKFRLSELSSQSISTTLEKMFLEHIKSHIHEFDLIIFSDFNYGFLSDELISKIQALASENSVPCVADCQSSSQVGDITKYKGLLLATPTEREARLGLKNQSDGLVTIAECLRQETVSDYVLLKLAGEGLLVHAKFDDNVKTDQLPALNQMPSDVSGAGDALLIAASLALISGGSIWEASYIGSLAAAIQVSRNGNIPISLNDLFSEIA